VKKNDHFLCQDRLRTNARQNQVQDRFSSVGFLHETVLYAGVGVSRTLRGWGDRLLLRGGKQRVEPYSQGDFVLSHLGFWTDHGAYYYHNHDNYSSAEAAMKEVVRLAHAQGVPLRYAQFDDWWFQQDGGAINTSNRVLFHSLSAFNHF
jgi:hypothetical protein